jgi:hypothetical protein
VAEKIDMSPHNFRGKFAVVDHSQPVESVLQGLLRLLEPLPFLCSQGITLNLINGETAEAAEGAEIDFLAAVFKIIIDHRQLAEGHICSDLDEKS